MKLGCVTDSDYYVEQHQVAGLEYRPWAILEPTRYGPRLFDVYPTAESAYRAAAVYDLRIINERKV